MGYRDERRALDDRANALREEIDELLTELETLSSQAEGREREAFWRRADDLPASVTHHRPSMSSMRPFVLGGVGMLALVGFIALMAENPVKERVGGMVVMVLFVGLFLGVVVLIIRLTRNRSVDANLDGDGLRIEGRDVDELLAWHDLERLRLHVRVTSSQGGRNRTGYLAVRREGVWSEHMLEDISMSTEGEIYRWVDWLLGVKLTDP